MPKMFVMRDYAECHGEEGVMQHDSTMRLIHKSDLITYVEKVLTDTTASIPDTIAELESLDVGQEIQRIWLGDMTDIIRVA